MSVLTCGGCGGLTNTTTCDFLEHKDMKPRECYVRWKNGIAEKGCGFDSMDEKTSCEAWYRNWCLKIIGTSILHGQTAECRKVGQP